MKIIVVSGSTRPRSSSQKVALAVQQLARQVSTDGDATARQAIAVEIIDFSRLDLPIWDAELKHEVAQWQQQWQSCSAVLRGADALVIVSPEWEEVCLDNFYAFCQHDSIALLPTVILRVNSDCRGNYAAKDLWLPNFCQRSPGLILEHMTVASIDAVNNCKKEYYAFDPEVAARVKTVLDLLARLFNRGSLQSLCRQLTE